MESNKYSVLTTLTYVFLAAIAVCDITSGVLSAIIIAGGAKDVVSAFVTSISFVAVFVILISLLHKYLNWGEVTSNVANLVTFGILWLIGLCLCIGSTVHARNMLGHHPSTVPNPQCVPTYALLTATYLSSVLALVGFGIAWADKYPGAIEVQPRYKITKAPSSHFAALAYPLDEELACKLPSPPVKQVSSRHMRQPNGMPRRDRWTDVPL